MSERHKDDERLDPSRVKDARTGDSAAANRIREQAKCVDLQIQQAMARGEFDNLPGAGKPIKNLGAEHDPDWWVKQLIEREQITGVLPPALQLRKDDAELDAKLDELHVESEVRTRARGVQRPRDQGPLHPGRRAAPDHPAPRRRGRGQRVAGASCRAARRTPRAAGVRGRSRSAAAGSGVECVIPRGSRPLLRSAHA